jgi:hypothetical protein
MNKIAGVNALFFGVCTGNSWAIAAAPPKIANVSQPPVFVESPATLGKASPAATTSTDARYALAGRESRLSCAAAVMVFFIEIGRRLPVLDS